MIYKVSPPPPLFLDAEKKTNKPSQKSLERHTLDIEDPI